MIVCSLKLAQDDVVVSGCLGGKGTVVRLLIIKLMLKLPYYKYLERVYSGLIVAKEIFSTSCAVSVKYL